MKRVLTVGLTYTGALVGAAVVETRGLCRPAVNPEAAALPLYEYDTIIINPASYTHFLLGRAGLHSDDPYELGRLAAQDARQDIDLAFDVAARQREMEMALSGGATVIWCLSDTKRMNYFGHRDTHLGYVAPAVANFVQRAGVMPIKCHRIETYDRASPFAGYFRMLAKTGGKAFCLPRLAAPYASVAHTREGFSFGGKLPLEHASGWILTPPTGQSSSNELIRNSVTI